MSEEFKVAHQQATMTQDGNDGLQHKNYINILILGETGVEKSAWINGFVNFFFPRRSSRKENIFNCNEI